MFKNKFIQLTLIIILLVMGIFVLSGCNKQVFDTNYTFDKAITYLGNERIEIEIDKWNDYEGEQIQVIGKDGKVYLLSMNNTILVKERK